MSSNLGVADVRCKTAATMTTSLLDEALGRRRRICSMCSLMDESFSYKGRDGTYLAGKDGSRKRPRFGRTRNSERAGRRASCWGDTAWAGPCADHVAIVVFRSRSRQQRLVGESVVGAQSFDRLGPMPAADGWCSRKDRWDARLPSGLRLRGKPEFSNSRKMPFLAGSLWSTRCRDPGVTREESRAARDKPRDGATGTSPSSWR
jgi:hypothetical protein